VKGDDAPPVAKFPFIRFISALVWSGKRPMAKECDIGVD
jgi:hypothetical protein